ncbi:MAG: polysaccharide biosynthesis tyrosine autokinase [Desulfobacterales bacterium]
MGKIHKALEKSKKEKSGRPGSGSSALYADDGGRNEVLDRDVTDHRDGLGDSASGTPEFDLGTIHELLQDPLESGSAGSSEKSHPGKPRGEDMPAHDPTPTAAPASRRPPDRSAMIVNGKPVIEVDVAGSQGRRTPKEDARESLSRGQVNGNPALVDPWGPRPEGKAVPTGRAAPAGKETEKKVVVLREKTPPGAPRHEAPEKSSTGARDYVTAEPSYTESTGYTPVNGLLVALLKPRSYEAEQFKILRTNLLFPETGKPARSILITSAAPGDGKSFVSSNLAVSLALDHDRKVLLIDADVRRSAIHRIFGLNGSEKGICDFLTDRMPLASLLVKTSLNNLFILPAGQLTHAPDQLQSLERLPRLFDELAASFGDFYIVIDSPPPKLAAETGVLARLVDRIVIVMKAGVTKKEYVEETIELVDKGKIAGIVFNWHENRMSNYRKYAKKREYYS